MSDWKSSWDVRKEGEDAYISRGFMGRHDNPYDEYGSYEESCHHRDWQVGYRSEERREEERRWEREQEEREYERRCREEYEQQQSEECAYWEMMEQQREQYGEDE